MPTQRTQNFNAIKLTTSNNLENDIILNEINGHLHINNDPVAISGSFGASSLSDFNFNRNEIEGFNASIVNSTAITYTVSSSDSGKLIAIEHASLITITVPANLGAGFNCTFIQKGSGQITFSEDGTTINNRQSHFKTAGQFAVASLLCYESDKFILTGDTI